MTHLLYLIPSDANSMQGWVALIQLVISAVTGFFLIQTFILQAKTFQQQQKVTEMESLNYRIRLKPTLNLVSSNQLIEDARELYSPYQRYELLMRVGENNLKNLRIDIKRIGAQVHHCKLPRFGNTKIWLPGELFGIEVGLLEDDLEEYRYDDDSIYPAVIFRFSYEDMMDVKYQQKIKYTGVNFITVYSASLA